jgi:hypothetical protein
VVSGDIKGVFIMYFETSELGGGNAESDRVPRTERTEKHGTYKTNSSSLVH